MKIKIRRKVAILALLSVSALGVYAAQPHNRETTGWQSAASAAPQGLMEQVVVENLNPDVQIDVGQMQVWKIQQAGQPQAIYLIDTRTAQPVTEAARNPLCGDAGCVFLGYIPTHHANFQQVWRAYLDVHLPPTVPLLDVMDELQNDLPVLQLNQLVGDRIEQSVLAFNGQTYEVTETRLLPQRYE